MWHRFQQLGGLLLGLLRQIVEDIGDLVVPASLLLPGRMDLAEGCPYPEVPVGHRELREREASVLEIAQDHEPTFLTLGLTALARQHDLLSRGERVHDREECALAVLDAHLHIEAVGQPVDDRQIRQVRLLPGLLVEFEPCLESLNRARRQRRALAQQAAQRQIKVAGRQPVQI